MPLKYSILVIIFIIFVIFLVRAALTGEKKQEYILKPLSSILAIVIALLSCTDARYNLTYTILIVTGLLFSLGGDIVLMFESGKIFVIGLVLFLIAHIAYAAGFSAFSGFHPRDIFSAIVLLAIAAILFRFLRKGLGNMMIPVLIYITVINVMVHRAFSTTELDFFNLQQALCISIGAVLFSISDIMLALNRFAKPFKYHRLNLAFYYAGQLLIALSTGLYN